MRRGLEALLIVSLALNLGLVGGGLARLMGNGDADWVEDVTLVDAGGTADPEDSTAAVEEGQLDESGVPRGMRGRPAWRRGWGERRADRLGRRMGLGPEQRGELRRAFVDLEPRISSLRIELDRRRVAMAEELMAVTPNAARVRDGQHEISVRQAQLDSLVAEAMLIEARVLPPEQRRIARMLRDREPRPHGRGFRPGP